MGSIEGRAGCLALLMLAAHGGCVERYRVDRNSIAQFTQAPADARRRWVIPAERDPSGRAVLVRPAALELGTSADGKLPALGKRLHPVTTNGLVLFGVGAALLVAGSLFFTLPSCGGSEESCIVWGLLGTTLMALGGTQTLVGGIMALATMRRREAEVPPGNDRLLYR
jgi:hypothetical protein